MSFFRFAAAFASASLFLACPNVVVEAPEDPARLRSDTLYTDTELRFSVALPAGWAEHSRLESDATLDFLAGKGFSEPLRYGELRIGHWTAPDDTGSLADYVAGRYDRPWPYDSVGIALEMRAGVEVARVEVKSHSFIGGDPTPHHERWRDLYFRRQGRMIRMRIQDHPDYFDASVDVRFIDSSLTFF